MAHQNITVNPEGNTMSGDPLVRGTPKSYIYPPDSINKNDELRGNRLALLYIELCHQSNMTLKILE